MFWEAMGNSITAASSLSVWGSLIRAYGYLAVAAGVFLEGETVMILGGFSVHRGYLSLPGMVLAAFIGALFGDWLFFYLGRAQRHLILDRKPEWKKRVDHVNQLLLKHRDGLIIARRFFYGLRNLTAFVIGMSPIRIRKFIALNIISAVLWTVFYGLLGYFFGGMLRTLLGDLRQYEGRILMVMITLMLGVALVQFYRLRKRSRQISAGPQ
ncbi:DedA family protein [candidate division FCPU426 bacterium]|nr:DedA family protein [candidate division FCPU426 bacterium]